MTAVQAQVERVADCGEAVPVSGAPIDNGHLKKERKDAAILVLEEVNGNVSEALRRTGICRQVFYHWLKEDADFAERVEGTREQAADRMEAEADRRAVEGFDKPVFFKGQQCGTIRQYSDLLLIFRLKSLRPDQYRENVALSGHDGGPLFRMVAGVTPQRVCGVEPEPKLSKTKAKALLASDASKQPVEAVESVKS